MKFLISAYTGLGNFILKTPLIRAIHEQFPNVEVDLLCGCPWGAEEVLEHSKWINHIYWYPPGKGISQKIYMLKALRSVKYDVVFFPFDSTPKFMRFTAFLLNAKKIISHLNLNNQSKGGNIKTTISILFGLNTSFVPILTGRHESELNLDLLEPLLTKPTERNLQTFVQWKKEKLPFNLPDNYIVLQLAARNGSPTPKTWDPQNFFEIITRWQKDHPKDIFVLVGDKGDAEFLLNIPTLKTGVINLLGMTNFNQLCNVINDSKVVISHDSGVMHLANALQRPLIALYGPTDFTRTAPLNSASHIIQSRNECWARMYSFRESEDDLANQYEDYYCMSSISVDSVLCKMSECTS